MDSLYVDTCVHRDSYQKRTGRGLVPLYEQADRLFERVLGGEYKLVTSDHQDFQLSSFPEYQKLVSDVKKLGNHIHVITDSNDKKEANSGAVQCDDYEDTLHLILAAKVNCKWFATQDRGYPRSYKGVRVVFPDWVGMSSLA